MGLIIKDNVVVKYEEDDGVTEVVIPEGITEIGESAFYGCKKLKSIILPENIIVIGTYAFSYSKSLANINLPKSIRTIRQGAFYQCSNLDSITLPEGITTIEISAFNNCRNLKNITLPESIITIGNQAFAFCKGLTNITLPRNVKIIGEYAFAFSVITSIKIPDSVTEIEMDAFLGCNIENIDISSYKVFLLLDDKLKLIACSSIVKNISKGKLIGSEIRNLKNYIKESKYELMPYALKSIDLLNFMLYDIENNFITMEEASDLIMKTSDAEIRGILLNYIHKNQVSKLNQLDEFDLEELDDELGNSKKLVL